MSLSLRGRSGTRSHPYGRANGFTRAISVAVPPLLVAALLALLLPLGLGSTVGSAAAVGLAVLLITLVTIGIEKTATVLLGLAVLLAPMNNVKPVAAITFVTASDVFLLLGVGVLIPVLMTKGFQHQTPFLVGTVGLVAIGLVSSAAAPAAGASLNGLLRLVVGALILPLVFMLWRPGRRVLVLFAGAYVAGASFSVAKGRISGISSAEGRYAGLTEHPNILGLTCMLAITLIPFLFHALPRKHRWMVLGAGAVCAYGVWISGSRAALVGVVIIALLYLVLSRSVEYALLAFGLSIIPLYVVGKDFASNDVGSGPLGRLRGGGSATLSDVDREGLTRVALDKFYAHPIIGSGFGDASLAHNIYLQVAAAGGIIALIIYIGILASTLRQPLALGHPYRLLALSAMGYAVVGPLTPLLWDRYIWCVLALPFLIPRPDTPDSADTVPASAGTHADH